MVILAGISSNIRSYMAYIYVSDKNYTYRTVLISPRHAKFFDPLAVCREHLKYLSYMGLAKLAL